MSRWITSSKLSPGRFRALSFCHVSTETFTGCVSVLDIHVAHSPTSVIKVTEVTPLTRLTLLPGGKWCGMGNTLSLWECQSRGMARDADKHIRVREETWVELNRHKRPGDSFDDVMQRLLERQECDDAKPAE